VLPNWCILILFTVPDIVKCYIVLITLLSAAKSVRKLQLRAARKSGGANLGHALLKTFISFGGGLKSTCHHMEKLKARTLQLFN
jgi:hypothetical protein